MMQVFLDVLIPSSSGQLSKLGDRARSPDAGGLNPFFIRSIVETKDGRRICRHLLVLIPSSSGQLSKRS